MQTIIQDCFDRNETDDREAISDVDYKNGTKRIHLDSISGEEN